MGAQTVGESVGSQSTAGTDPFAKLAKAKGMLDRQLISEIEYEALNAKILAAM